MIWPSVQVCILYLILNAVQYVLKAWVSKIRNIVMKIIKSNEVMLFVQLRIPPAT